MPFPVRPSRRLTALLVTGGVRRRRRAARRIARRRGPRPAYGKALGADLRAGAVRGLDPALREVAGRPDPGRRAVGAAAAPAGTGPVG